MTREEQIVGAAKAKEKETEFCELVKSRVSKGVDSAFGIGFIEGAVWADEHPNDEVLKLRKMFESDPDAYKQGYKDAIDKVCEWLYKRQQVDLVVPDIEKFISEFKKETKEQQ
jgi:hypothetical protein